MRIKATFTAKHLVDVDPHQNPPEVFQEVVMREMEIDWENRAEVRRFASESDCWLRRGPFYKVTTECVAYKPGELVREVFRG